jgi:hypothetical protein
MLESCMYAATRSVETKLLQLRDDRNAAIGYYNQTLKLKNRILAKG